MCPLLCIPFDATTNFSIHPFANIWSEGASNTPATRPDGLPVGEFRPLQNHRCFLKIQPRIARVELAWISIAQVAEQIDLPLAVRKELRIQFVCVKTGHRSAIQAQSACGQDEVCG